MNDLQARLENVEKSIEVVNEQNQKHVSNGYKNETEDFHKYNAERFSLQTKLNALKELEWRIELELVRSEGAEIEA
ncbi:hypothetical protein [Bacillus sp. Bos-x628]|uniref:hypothetical protein n=1 Tax=Bacillus maqinnsis TaxID=3229854 RepID=UPI00338E73E4